VSLIALSAAPEASLTQYLQEIRKLPMLSAEKEDELARRWRDNQDTEAARQLVTSHLRLVAKIAMNYRGYGMPISELISEGNLGILRALRRYNPDRGFRFATYAMYWIRAEIQEYVLHSWSLVRIGTTAAQKKLFFNLRRMKARLQAIDNGDLQPGQVTEIANRLKVPEEAVVSMNRRLGAPDQSLNARVATDSETEWQDSLVDEDENQESILADREEFTARKHLLNEALKLLDDRQHHIIIERQLKENPATLEELSHQYGISRERVRQIEAGAMQKIRQVIARSAAGRAHHASTSVALW
jgi:RNA polymerase sigma-32 factor